VICRNATVAAPFSDMPFRLSVIATKAATVSKDCTDAELIDAKAIDPPL
jgi:hypothetical protein